MVAVRFSFLYEKIRSGEKKQTIRLAKFYKHLKVGDSIQCYSTKKVKGVKRRVIDELLYEGVVTEIRLVTWDEIKDNDVIIRLDGFENKHLFWKAFAEMYGVLEGEMFRVIRWK